MKKIILLLIISIIIIFATLLFIFANVNSQDKVCIRSQCFNVEVAQTLHDRQQGLMYRPSLPIDQGMLFIFPTESKHSFWMKNTLIPLDIIWISKDKEIVHINHNTPPCQENPCPSYTPNRNALYILEINAGLAEQFNFQLQDSVSLPVQ